MIDRDTAASLRASLDSLAQTLTGIQRSVTRVERRIDHEMARLHASTYRSVESLLATYRLLDSRPPLPRLAGPFGGWTVSVDMARLIGELIRSKQPTTVVELGSGASTVFIAMLLRDIQGATLVSLEHDSAWYAKTLEELYTANLEDSVDLRYAPVEDVEVDGGRYPWYATESIEDIGSVDLLLIDGPPGSFGPMARYPAGPLFEHRLAPGALVVLDDFSRPQEQESVRLWEEQTDLTLVQSHLWHTKGAAVLQLRDPSDTA